MGRALALGAETLHVGRLGQRWLQRGALWRHAERPLPEDLAGIVRGADGSFDFVTESGTVHRCKEPLGDPFETRRARYTRVSASSDAILAVDDGGLVRSTDRGVSWSRIAIAEGTVHDAILARDGRGLALLAPERILATRDHGATWTLAGLPDLDPERVSLADDGAPYVGTAARGAKLEDDGFGVPRQAETPEPPAPSIVAIAVHEKRIVLVAHEKPNTEPTVAVTTLEGKRVLRPIAGLGACSSVAAAAAADHVVVACDRGNPSALVIARSYDDGKTFRLATPIPIHVGWHGQLHPIVAGEAGLFAYVDGDEIHLVRKEGKAPTLIAKIFRPEHLALDASRARLLVGSADGIFAATFDATKAEPLPDVQKPSARVIAMRIDADGLAHLHVAPHLPPIDGSLELYDVQAERMSFAGARGLLATRSRLYETVDGGAHLRDVGAAPAGPFACSAEGCAFAGSSRLGWNDDPGPVVPATSPRLANLPEPPPITCTRRGKKLLADVAAPELEAHLFPSPHVPFRIPTSNGMVTGSFEKPALTSLFSPTKRPAMTVFHSVPGGFVAMRYLDDATEDAPEAPMSLELAWRREGEKTIHKKITKTLGAFPIHVGVTVEDPMWSYAAGIVDGGIIVRPAHPRVYGSDGKTWVPPAQEAAAKDLSGGHDPFLFVRDSAQVESVKPPPGPLEASAIFRGKDRWFVVPRTSYEVAKIWISADLAGTSWLLRRIRLSTTGDSITLASVDGAPAFVVIDERRGFVAALALDGSRALTVRPFVVPDLDVAHACTSVDPQALRAVVAEWGRHATVGEVSVFVSRWVLSVPRVGPACVLGVGGTSSPGADDFWHGLFIPAADPSRSMHIRSEGWVESVDCQL